MNCCTQQTHSKFQIPMFIHVHLFSLLLQKACIWKTHHCSLCFFLHLFTYIFLVHMISRFQLFSNAAPCKMFPGQTLVFNCSSDIQYRSKVSYSCTGHCLARCTSFLASALEDIQTCFVFYRTDLCSRHDFSFSSPMRVYHVCIIRTSFCLCKPATSCGFLCSLALGSYKAQELLGSRKLKTI